MVSIAQISKEKKQQCCFIRRGYIIVIIAISLFSILGCRVFHKGKYNGGHYKMFFPRKWEEGSWMIPTVLPAESLYEPELFTAESPKRHKATGTPDASISLFSQKMEQVVWMEDLYPVILREYARSGYAIMQKGEIKIDGNIFKWMLSKNTLRNEVAMDFYHVSDASVFYKIQYASHLDTYNKYRRDFEESKATMQVKITFL